MWYLRRYSEVWQVAVLSPMKRNSVFEELRVKMLEVIQEEICCRTPWRYVMLECTSEGWKEKKSCVSSAYRWWFRERNEMSELRGVVYMIKRREPRAELAERRKTGMERRETTFKFHTEQTRGQIRFEPVKDSASYSKPLGKIRQ